jgi:hypothetical protein
MGERRLEGGCNGSQIISAAVWCSGARRARVGDGLDLAADRCGGARVYRRISTATKYGCDMWAYAPTVYPGRVRPGTACAQLYRSGVYVTEQCHSIY